MQPREPAPREATPSEPAPPQSRSKTPAAVTVSWPLPFYPAARKRQPEPTPINRGEQDADSSTKKGSKASYGASIVIRASPLRMSLRPPPGSPRASGSPPRDRRDVVGDVDGELGRRCARVHGASEVDRVLSRWKRVHDEVVAGIDARSIQAARDDSR